MKSSADGDGKQQLERLPFTKISADRVRRLWEQLTHGEL